MYDAWNPKRQGKGILSSQDSLLKESFIDDKRSNSITSIQSALEEKAELLDQLVEPDGITKKPSACYMGFKTYEGLIWKALFISTSITLWVCMIFIDQIFKSGTDKRIFRSVALAPLGVWVRWGLARLPKLIGETK
jgi:hypothetical protein